MSMYRRSGRLARATIILCLGFSWLGFSGAAAAASPASDGARRASFNDGWRFHLGDLPEAQQMAFRDTAWTALRLPHDWAIGLPFDPKLNPHTGALPVSGIGWYRKTFTLPSSARQRYVTLEFDGAMANARVWLNGKELGGRPYGYMGFNVDLSADLRWDGKANVLAVRVAPEADASRWYPGAGIYRNVWLEITGPVHVARWGTYVTTPEVTAAHATIAVQTEVRNRAWRSRGRVDPHIGHRRERSAGGAIRNPRRRSSGGHADGYRHAER